MKLLLLIMIIPMNDDDADDDVDDDVYEDENDDVDDVAPTNMTDIWCLSVECLLPQSELDFCKMILCPNIALALCTFVPV